MRAAQGRFRRIFVPVDGTGSALAAARLATRFAKSQRARVRGAYVVDRAMLQGGGVALPVRDRLREELGDEGRAALRRVEALCRGYGVPYSQILLEGDVVSELVKAARRFRADLMVVGTRGHGRLKALLLGSLVSSLIHQAPCPLLIVRGADRRRTGAR